MPPRSARFVPHRRDLLVAALAVLVISVITAHIDPAGALADGGHRVDGLTYACIAVAGAALAWRNRLPLTVVGLVTVALVVYSARGYPGGPIFLTWYVALFSVAMVRQRTVGFVAAAVSVAAFDGVALAVDPGLQPVLHLVFIAWAAAAVLLGDAVRSRHERVAAIQERARQLEQSREDEARRRVAEERLRIARDLHDSVAHSMATINVHAGAAAHVIDRRPDEARTSLQVIERASREVLQELTAMLQLLRFDAPDGAERVPTPGLGQLPALADSVRAAGVDVRLDLRPPPDVPQPVEVAVYRIVQESLTNVIRHAGRPVTARVVVTGGEDGALSVEVVDDGNAVRGNGAPGSNGSRVGIVGMRERAEATGGRLDAGPRSEGRGFAVRASWPARVAR